VHPQGGYMIVSLHRFDAHRRVRARQAQGLMSPRPTLWQRLKLGVSFIAAWACLALLLYGWLDLLSRQRP